jgi:hypothetical protein
MVPHGISYLTDMNAVRHNVGKRSVYLTEMNAVRPATFFFFITLEPRVE